MLRFIFPSASLPTVGSWPVSRCSCLNNFNFPLFNIALLPRLQPTRKIFFHLILVTWYRMDLHIWQIKPTLEELILLPWLLLHYDDSKFTWPLRTLPRNHILWLSNRRIVFLLVLYIGIRGERWADWKMVLLDVPIFVFSCSLHVLALVDRYGSQLRFYLVQSCSRRWLA